MSTNSQRLRAIALRGLCGGWPELAEIGGDDDVRFAVDLYGVFPVKWLFFGFCSQFFVRSGKGRSSFFNRAAGVKKVLSASGLRRIVVSPLVGRHWRNAVSLFG